MTRAEAMSVEVKQDAKGVWYARPYLGTAPDGAKIRPYRQFPEAATRAQAQELANHWISQLSAGGKVKSAIITDLLKTYIAERKVKGISPYTVKRWNLFARSYVGKYLKGKSACKLSVMDLSDFETRLLLPKEKRGQGLSRNTVRSVHFFLRGAYNYWVKSGVCEMNPLFYVEPPAEEKHEAVALDEWDYPGLDEAITASLHPDELNEKTMREAAYAFAAWLALHTGMRVGEVCAMRRRDVFRRLGYLHVCGKIVELDGGGLDRVDVTKGRKSRNVSMTAREFETVFGFIALQDAFSEAFTPNSPLGMFIWPLAEHPKLLSLTPWQVRSRKRFHYCCLRAIQGCSLECHQQRGPFCKGPLYFRSVPNSLTITNQLASSTASLSAPTLMQA